MKTNFFVIGLFFIAAGLFVGRASTTQLSKCEIAAINIHESLQAAGYSHADAYEISGIAQEWCEWGTSF